MCEQRDFLAQVTNSDGVNILTTPTETSVWKGRLEKDKVRIPLVILLNSYLLRPSRSPI